MAGTLTPTPYQTVLDGDGVAVSGAKVYTYEAGTTTNATTYTTSDLSVANANPIVADSAGRYVAYLSAGANLRFIIKTSADVTIDDQDNVQAVPGAAVNLDVEGTVGEAVTAGQVVYMSSAAEASPLTAGLWYLTDADAAPTSTTAQTIGVAVSAIAINTAGTIRLAGLATTAGAVVVGTTYYVSATAGAITASAPTLSRQVGVAMTTSSLLLAAGTRIVGSIPNPITQDLLFTDNTYDIGKSGATRPRDFFASRNVVIGGTGPHVIGGTTNDYTRLGLAGTFASGGASDTLWGTHVSGSLTGHSGDSAEIAGVKLNNTVVTAGNCTTVAQLWVKEPNITVGSGTVTNSATLYIEDASTAGTNDYALWVDEGATRLDGTLTVGDTGASALDVGGGINVGTGDVALVGTDGKINGPLSSTIIDDLSGANLTTLNASNVSSGTLANARLPSNVDLGGTLDVTGVTTLDSTLGVASDVAVATSVLFVDVSATAIGVGTATPNYLSAPAAITLQGSTQPRLEIVGTRTGDDTTGQVMFINRVSTTNNVIGYIAGNRSGADNSGSLTFHTYNAGSAVAAMTLSPAGALSKASGSFKIDHPLPSKTDTHYLVHSFIEGPRADLIYRGSATLVAGSATVDLDTAAEMTAGTWVLLCRDPQVFTSNESGWDAVRGSVSGKTLTISCQDATSTDTVSWMVVAERQDQHMYDTDWTDDEGHVIVEPEKPEEPEP